MVAYFVDVVWQRVERWSCSLVVANSSVEPNLNVIHSLILKRKIVRRKFTNMLLLLCYVLLSLTELRCVVTDRMVDDDGTRRMNDGLRLFKTSVISSWFSSFWIDVKGVVDTNCGVSGSFCSNWFWLRAFPSKSLNLKYFIGLGGLLFTVRNFNILFDFYLIEWTQRWCNSRFTRIAEHTIWLIDVRFNWFGCILFWYDRVVLLQNVSLIVDVFLLFSGTIAAAAAVVVDTCTCTSVGPHTIFRCWIQSHTVEAARCCSANGWSSVGVVNWSSTSDWTPGCDFGIRAIVGQMRSRCCWWSRSYSVRNGRASRCHIWQCWCCW